MCGGGKSGIAFDCFQQMKVTIGAARVIEKALLELCSSCVPSLDQLSKTLTRFSRKEEKLKAPPRGLSPCVFFCIFLQQHIKRV